VKSEVDHLEEARGDDEGQMKQCWKRLAWYEDKFFGQRGKVSHEPRGGIGKAGRRLELLFYFTQRPWKESVIGGGGGKPKNTIRGSKLPFLGKV